jgi:hypothetical protein
LVVDAMSSLVSLVLAAALAVPSGVVRVEADRDGTLIEHPTGALANGSGAAFYVGRTNQAAGSIRRALLRFDLEGALPPGAVVVEARLVAEVSSLHEPNEIRLHRLLQDWGEGASASSGGQGAPAQPGDATWIHAFHDAEPWDVPGALPPVTRASARALAKTVGPLEWRGARLRRDVEAWIAAPETNFGWLLVGDELTPQNVTRLESRESPEPELRPVLEITYRTGRARR